MAASNSVLKAFKILEVISQYPEGINLTGIVKETGLPKSTVFDICDALYQVDAIYFKNPVTKYYVIGSKMYVMGQVYTKNSNMINAAIPFLQSFADKHGVSVSVAKRLHNTSVNVYKYDSKDSKVVTQDIGNQVKLNENASGKVFLAYLNEERRNEAFKKLNCDKNKEIQADISKILQNGYSYDDNVSSEYIYSIAVPIFNFENKNVGVISTTALKSNINIDEQIKELVSIGKTVSKILGYLK